jgi:hypothetical protein
MTWSMCDLALWLFLIIAICSVQQGELSPCYRTILYAFARFLRDVGAVGLLWRCSVRMTPIRAIIVGPPLSATSISGWASQSQRQLSQRAQNFMTFGNTQRPRAAGGNLCRGRPASLAKAVLPAVGFGFWGREYRF